MQKKNKMQTIKKATKLTGHFWQYIWHFTFPRNIDLTFNCIDQAVSLAKGNKGTFYRSQSIEVQRPKSTLQGGGLHFFFE